MRYLTRVLVLGTIWLPPLGTAAEGLSLTPLPDKALLGTSTEAVRALVEEYDRLLTGGLLPVVGGPVTPPGDPQFGTVDVFGVDIPVIVLAKLALIIILIATKGGGPIIDGLNALVEGEVFPIGPREDELANIVHGTAGTAMATFEGTVQGEMNFAQARLPAGDASVTIVMADLHGLRPGLYVLQLQEEGPEGGGPTKGSCSSPGPLYNPQQEAAGQRYLLGTMKVGASGRGSVLLTSSASLEGPASIVGRSVTVVGAEEGPGGALVPREDPQIRACAVIERQ